MNFNDDYFQWLCELIGVQHKHHSYLLLTNDLHNKKFEYILEKDSNRAADGIALRERYIADNPGVFVEILPNLFITEYKSLEEVLNEPCSILELFISMAYRYEGIVYEKKFKTWYWNIISNIGLLDFHDEQYGLDNDIKNKFETIIKTFLERTYSSDGKGGMFPISNPTKDQTKVELWYQMQEYIMEHHYYS